LAYDNICKYLAEEYPTAFASWLFPEATTDIQVLKTELSVEPIRADSLTLLQTSNQILHLEFQTLPTSEPPLPFRMLDYWVRLKRQYRCDIEQVVIFLKSSNSATVFTNQFEDKNTRHGYRVIRLWEEDPTPLLTNPALLPLATLAYSNSPNALLEQVAAQVDMIEEPRQRENLAACVTVLAGLRFDDNLVNQLFREEIMQESVTYQRILQKGLQQGQEQGKQQGRQEEAQAMIIRLLTRRFGVVAPQVREQIENLSITQLEDLGEALLDFSSTTDLTGWLNQHQQ
jgi:predicted transposase/invertase (TIGR01784 family)